VRERTLASRKFPGAFGNGIAWSPDGKLIAVTALSPTSQNPDHVVLLDAATGSERSFQAGSHEVIWSIGWLPDQSGLIIAAGPDFSSQIWKLPYPKGDARRITRDLSDYASLTSARDSNVLVGVQMDFRSQLWAISTHSDRESHTVANSGSSRDGVWGLAWAPDGGLVFTSMASGNWDLWRADADGSNSRQLTTDPSSDFFPSLSPDGQTILFHSNRNGTWDLWKMNSDGSNSRQLTHGQNVGQWDASEVAWFLPNGRAIVYSVRGQSTVLSVSPDGGRPEPLLPDYDMPPGFLLKDVSPDGRTLLGNYIDTTAKVYRLATVPTDGSHPWKRLDIQGVDVAPGNVQWTGDGKDIYYVRTERDVSNIWRVTADGRSPRQITHFTGDQIVQFAVSPANHWLAAPRVQKTADVVLIKGSSQPQHP
jgi:TolB protein